LGATLTESCPMTTELKRPSRKIAHAGPPVRWLSVFMVTPITQFKLASWNRSRTSELACAMDKLFTAGNESK